MLPLLLLLLASTTTSAFEVWAPHSREMNPCLGYTCAPGYQCFNHGPGRRECFDPMTGTYSMKKSTVHFLGNGFQVAPPDAHVPVIPGIGTNAQLGYPAGMVAVHGTQRDFLLAQGSGVVSYVRGMTGEVVNIAGDSDFALALQSADGVGTAALFETPSSMVYAPLTGLYYVLDLSRIRTLQLSVADGGAGPATVGTLAGGDLFGDPLRDGVGTVATFALSMHLNTYIQTPYDVDGTVVLGPDGRTLFFTESWYGAIRKIDIITSSVTTLQGTPFIGWADPSRVCTTALLAAAGLVFSADLGSLLAASGTDPVNFGAVCRLDIATNNMTLHAGAKPPNMSTQNGTTSFSAPSVRSILPIGHGNYMVTDGHTLRSWDGGTTAMPIMTKNDVSVHTLTCDPEFGAIENSRLCNAWGTVRVGDGTVFVSLRHHSMVVRIDETPE